MLSPSKAAQLAKVSKPTILRAIKSGKLSAHRQENGTYLIDPSEVIRVFADSVSQSAPPLEPDVPGGMIGARELIAALERQIEDLKLERDRWHAQAERLALVAPARVGVFRRLFGKAA